MTDTQLSVTNKDTHTHTHTHTACPQRYAVCSADTTAVKQDRTLLGRRMCAIAGFHGSGHDVDFHKCYVIYSRITTTNFPSFCMLAFSASPTNLTVLLTQSRD